MGYFKTVAMDLEQMFIDLCFACIEDGMRFDDYFQQAMIHTSYVDHLSDEEIAELIRDVWHESNNG